MHKHTKEQFIEAVTTSSNIHQALEKLGLISIGGAYKTFKKRWLEYGCPAFAHGKSDKDIRARISEDNLRSTVRESGSLRNTLQKLGLSEFGTNFKWIKKWIEEYQLDSSHFLSEEYRSTYMRPPLKPAKPIEELLIRDSHSSSNKLKKRLIKEGLLISVCSACGLSDTWKTYCSSS